MTTAGSPEPVRPPPSHTSEEARRLAQQHHLEQIGVRPGLWQYTVEVWRRRSFLIALAQGNVIARHQNNVLGLAWSLLTPLLLGGAYLVVFGLLLATRGDVENFIAFLLSGLLVFIFVSGAMTGAAKSLIDNVSMVRALRFPRVILPVSSTLGEAVATIPAFGVILVVALATGERPSIFWLLYPVALLIVTAVTTGIGLILARIVHEFRDAANLVPLMVRLLRYVSGVFFPIADYTTQAIAERGFPPWLAVMLEYQPVAVMLTMVRETLLAQYPPQWQTWAAAGGWALLFTVVGYVLFWRAEADYGRG